MKGMGVKRSGRGYEKRVADINRVYDMYARSGLSNREIWRRYIYPVYGICERTLYNVINASCVTGNAVKMEAEGFLFEDFFKQEDERRREDYFRSHP